MDKHQLESLKAKTVEPIASMGYELVDLDYVREQGDQVLIFYIYRPEGISIEDCERVSGMLNPLLDELDPIDEAYLLSVSSPDLNRPLKSDRDFERHFGKPVEIKLFQRLEGKKKYVGVLVSFDDRALTIDMNGTALSLERQAIATVKPAIIF